MSNSVSQEILAWAQAVTGVALVDAPSAPSGSSTKKPTKSMKTDHGVFTYYADRESELSSVLGPTFKLYETAYHSYFEADKQFTVMTAATKNVPTTKDAAKEVSQMNDLSMDYNATVSNISKEILNTFEHQFEIFKSELNNAEGQVQIAKMALDADSKAEEADKKRAMAETFETVFKTIGDLVAMANPLTDAITAPAKLLDAVAPFLDMVIPQVNTLKEEAKKLEDEARELRHQAAIKNLTIAQNFIANISKLLPKIKSDMDGMRPKIEHLYQNNEKQYDQLASKDKTKKFRFHDLNNALQAADFCPRLWKKAEGAAYESYNGVKKLAALVIGEHPQGNPDYIPPPSECDSMVVIGEMFKRSKQMFDEATPKRQNSEKTLNELQETRDAAHRALSKA